MSWKSIVNAVLPGSAYVFEKVGNGLKGAWDDYTGKTAVDRQNQYNMQMWQMQNEYNTPANQMQRYLQAGLNPNLIYSQGTPGNASSAPEMTAHQGSFAKALELGKLVLTLKQISAQNRNLNAQTGNINAQTSQHIADTEYKMAIIDFYNKHGYFPGQTNAPVNVVKDIITSSPARTAVEGLSRVLGTVHGAFVGPEPEFGDYRGRHMAEDSARRKGLKGAEAEAYIKKFINLYNLTH